MPLQSLIWTALPNGLTPDGRGLRLSVLVSPRLEPQTAPTSLATFADFAAWPTTLATARFTVRLGTSTITLGAADIDRTLGAPDLAAWRALFPADTFVRSFAMRDRSNDAVVSYDTVAMHELAEGIYARLAATADDALPTIEDLRGGGSLLGRLATLVATLDRTFFDRKTGGRDVAGQFARYRKDRFKGLDTPTTPLAAFQLFHTPPSKAITQTVPTDDPRTAVTWQTHASTPPDAVQAVKDIDFHQIVAAMNQYPTLLRRLGLVVDFVVPRTALPSGADLPLSVAVELPPPATKVTTASRRVTRRSASPVTRTRSTNAAFAPVPRPSAEPAEHRVANGLLRMEPDRFALLQADVDGAGHKLMNFARTLAAHAEVARQVDPVTKLARRTGAPALRNAGLMLVHRRRGEALSLSFTRTATRDATVQQAFVASAAGAAPTPGPALYAEDVARGWRIDVWDATTRVWRSLCERVADYRLDGGAVTLSGVREETTVRLAATTSADGTNPGIVYLHEAVTVWNGWSLAAQQPGLAIAPDDTKLRDAAADVPAGIRLRTSFAAAPGTLPRLRYGRTYAMRARVVDLAGNSLPPSTGAYEGDDAAVARAAPYLRFEPVQPPVLALVQSGASTEAPLEGESMGRLAVRTFNETYDDPTAAAQIARRWVVAARTSQREAELHGALDGPAWGTPAQFAMLAERDAELAQVTVSLAGPLDGPVHGPLDDEDLVRRPPVADDHGASTEPVRYAAMREGTMVVPYLPDPLCTRIAARLSDHPSIGSGTIIEIPLYRDGQAWPDAAPFFVRVYEAAGEVPRFDAPSRTLLVPTPKAVRATLRLSATPAADALRLFGVWNWVPEAERTPALRRRAEKGQLWPLTPWRTVAIVHAVQRPLLRPTMANMQLERSFGATFVRPGVDARCHRASTEHVELHAAWHEPRDAGGAPDDVAKTDVAFTVKLTDPQGYAGVAEHAVPDPADPDRIVFGPMKPLTETELRALPAKIHDFGDTRYRRVEYHLVGTSRFREFMPPSVLVERDAKGRTVTTDAHITLPGPIVVRWALSSAPPPAPEVLYAVPTFGWTRGTDAQGKRTSWRRGGGLRVWLDRPWNASGYGEMLGVVLPPAGVALEPNDPPYKHAVTQWGNDPIWKSPFVSGVAPKAADFPLARTAPDATGAWLPPGAPPTEADQPGPNFPVQNLRHPGLAPTAPTGTVDVAPHDVFWDPDRRLWYCDIEIAHGASYFPFVRLALARYQPSALYDAHLSSIVLADFAALTPDRWLSVTRTTATQRQVRVFGFAHDESSGHHEAWPQRTQAVNPITKKVMTFVPTGISARNVVEVWVEQLTPSLGEDFGWRRVADGVATPVAETVGRAPSATRVNRARDLLRRREFETMVAESALELAVEWPTLWSGAVTLPSAPAAGTRYRVVVAEYEEYLVDDAKPYETPLERKDRRLVFVEHVEVT